MKDPTLLSQLTGPPLARPCDEPWDQMVGDERVRHCGSCDRDVYDVSAMSPREAEIRLLNAGDRTPCVRYLRHADGTIQHEPEPRVHGRPAARPSFAAAAALGVTLSASPAFAKAKRQPDQCVAMVQQADIDAKNGTMVAAAKPAQEPIPGTAAFAEQPAAAAPPATPPAPPQPVEPIRLGGAPPPIQRDPAFGTLEMTSKTAREVTLVGIKLQAPLFGYQLTPGDFIASVRDADGKVHDVKFKISRGQTTRIDLDKKKKK